MNSGPAPSAGAPPAESTPASEAHAASEYGAHRHLPSILRFALVAGAGLALDLWSKHWAFHTLRQGGRIEILPNVLEFQTMLNRGALFGFGGGRTTLFLVASGFALVLVAWMFVQSSPRRWLLHIALGGILAGAIGNMFDRATVRLIDRPFSNPPHIVFMQEVGGDTESAILEEYPAAEGAFRVRVPRQGLPGEVGFVRDFIKISQRWFGGREVWPWVFNVADMLLVGGVSILAIYLWRDRKAPAEARP